MDWSELTSAADTAILNTLGEDILFTPSGQDEVEVRGIFNNAAVLVDQGVEVGDVKTRPTVFVKLSDLPSTPKQGDMFTVREVDYAIEETQEDGNGGALVVLYIK